ncbi:MAG: hypothetical protein A3C44_00360 [Gammaproteobacteria bacterium RIFCSPHIGHO2_02_FULL_39_13]|nr:MAG: hypothetical protein A3C44_00360 [Gammaproteobacteria bacterium RIFCSPHIGHO2_02_FULL_39_13]OGT48679.1 MAG: hypothetical protein A3E53_05330 [Gammaproteobacteria bacterium RIFCSPHIGHO2_12_FULL_39_24]
MLGWINIPAQTFHLSDEQNLWPVMSQHFKIAEDVRHTDVQHQIDTDLRHPKYIHRLTVNARPYLYYVYQETEKKHLPAELALLPMIESDYIPHGYSRKGADGLWQLMPSTANDYGIKMNAWYDGRRSTAVSTQAALNFLSYLYQLFNHNWLLALAAYNAGPGTVMEAIHYNQARGRPTNFWALPLPKQTKEYIPKLIAIAAIIQHPHTYGVRLAPVPNKPVTSTVTLKKQMHLKTIATMAHTTVNTVKKLNPALRRQVTPPHQTLTLVLPAEKKTTFVKHLAARKQLRDAIAAVAVAAKKKPSSAQHHEHTYTVRRGDNLHELAAEFHTTTYHIMEHNHLKTVELSIGQHLRLPNA